MADMEECYQKDVIFKIKQSALRAAQIYTQLMFSPPKYASLSMDFSGRGWGGGGWGGIC